MYVCMCVGGGDMVYGGRGLTLPLSDKVGHLFLTAASQTELKCQTLPDVCAMI